MTNEEQEKIRSHLEVARTYLRRKLKPLGPIRATIFATGLVAGLVLGIEIAGTIYTVDNALPEQSGADFGPIKIALIVVLGSVFILLHALALWWKSKAGAWVDVAIAIGGFGASVLLFYALMGLNANSFADQARNIAENFAAARSFSAKMGAIENVLAALVPVSLAVGHLTAAKCGEAWNDLRAAMDAEALYFSFSTAVDHEQIGRSALEAQHTMTKHQRERLVRNVAVEASGIAAKVASKLAGFAASPPNATLEPGIAEIGKEKLERMANAYQQLTPQNIEASLRQWNSK